MSVVGDTTSALLGSPLLDLESVGRDVAKANEEFLKNESEESKETPQPTRDASTTAVRLPPRDRSADVVALPVVDLSGARLEFPYAVDLDLQVNGQNANIIETRKEVVVASLSASGSEMRCEH